MLKSLILATFFLPFLSLTAIADSFELERGGRTYVCTEKGSGFCEWQIIDRKERQSCSISYYCNNQQVTLTSWTEIEQYNTCTSEAKTEKINRRKTCRAPVEFDKYGNPECSASDEF